MYKNKPNDFKFTLKHLSLLKDCYKLIFETIEEEIVLSTSDIEERREMLIAIDEIVDTDVVK